MNHILTVCLFLICHIAQSAGVQTSRVQHRSEADFKAGKTNDVLIDNIGRVTLGFRSTTLLENEEDVWVVNDLALDEGQNLYVATSGRGRVYRLGRDQQCDVVYESAESVGHVFAVAVDSQQRVLLGTGGEQAQLLRLDHDTREAIELPVELSYIWQIVIGPAGRIYLAGGSPGKILTLNADGSDARVLYESKEKNLLSLALDKRGFLYAGGDEKGLIYRIDLSTDEVTIAYDTGKGEISGLVLDEAGYLYASTASQNTARPGAQMLLSNGQAGRATQTPETGNSGSPDRGGSNGTVERGTVKPAGDSGSAEQVELPASQTQGSVVRNVKAPPTPAKPGRENLILKIAPDGYVQAVFGQPVMFLALQQDAAGNLLAGLAHEGTLLQIHPDTRDAVSLVQVEPSVQVTALEVSSQGEIYLGCSNPGQVVKLATRRVASGSLESDVVDAQQISRWGRLHVSATIPERTSLSFQTRSGNTRDPEHGGWETWRETLRDDDDFIIQSRAGRFLQYKAVLASDSDVRTPQMHAVELSYLRPNVPPVVTSVELSAQRSDDGDGAEPQEASGRWRVKWDAKDENDDGLSYDLFIRPTSGQEWIRLVREQNKTQYTWDARTFPDGRYEFKVVASDAPSNPAEDAMSGSRLSRVIVVDHTPPSVKQLTCRVVDRQVVVEAELEDELSVIQQVLYTVDSAETWKPVAARDGLLDSRREAVSFEIEIEDSGPHYVTLRFEDALGNGVSYYQLVDIP